jgi:hypothetical protein
MDINEKYVIIVFLLYFELSLSTVIIIIINTINLIIDIFGILFHINDIRSYSGIITPL